MSNNNSLILNYHDACIYNSDIRLLESRTEWLNDSCINYQMRRLEQIRKEEEQKRKKHDSTTHQMENNTGENNQLKRIGISHVEFIDPSIVSFFMHQLSIDDEDDRDEMVSLCQSWGLGTNKITKITSSIRGGIGEGEASMILIPINDNNSVSSLFFQTPGGGNHWSLLVVISLDMMDTSSSVNSTDEFVHSPEEQLMFFHFDSMNGSNNSTAVSVARKIQDMYSLIPIISHNDDKSTEGRNNEMNINDTNTSKEQHGIISSRVASTSFKNLTECHVVQQQNGYDCGVHTLFAAEVLGKMEYLSLKNTATFHSARNRECYDTTMKNIQDEFEKHIQMFLSDYGTIQDMTKSLRKSMVQDIRRRSACS